MDKGKSSGTAIEGCSNGGDDVYETVANKGSDGEVTEAKPKTTAGTEEAIVHKKKGLSTENILALRDERSKLKGRLREIEDVMRLLSDQSQENSTNGYGEVMTEREPKETKTEHDPKEKPELVSILKLLSTQTISELSIADDLKSKSSVSFTEGGLSKSRTSILTFDSKATNDVEEWLSRIQNEEIKTLPELYQKLYEMQKSTKSRTDDSVDNNKRPPNPRTLTYRRSWFADTDEISWHRGFRISKRSSRQIPERIESFFYNHGMGLALAILFVAINVLGAAHGAYQFTAIGGWTTENEILRITLPIARAGGRLVTINCAIILLTACKFLWTCVRTYIVPIIPIGFPIDDVMPKYHRYVALTVIISGCVIHTLPQIVNYASKSILLDSGMVIWTFGNGFATSQLFVTGILLTIVFSTFFLTTLKAVRKTPRGFRWFWFFHMLGVATAYPLLIIHGTYRGYPVFLYTSLLPLVLYVFDVAMRRLKVVSTRVISWKTFVDDGQEITELVLALPRKFRFTPGQYAEIKFPHLSAYEWHPFTIASAPVDNDDDDVEEKLVFYIKNAGRWTGALFNFASAFNLEKATRSMKIFLRGPHGAPAMNYGEYKHIIVIGSGVGTTPLLSIWKHLASRARKMSQGVSFKSLRSQRLSYMSFQESVTRELGLLSESGSVVDEEIGETQKSSKGKTRSVCKLLSNYLDSMTVSMIVFILIVWGETMAIVLQMFGFVKFSFDLGAALSCIALSVHVSSLVVSMVLRGFSRSARSFKFWLEIILVCVDSTAFAFGFSLTRRETTETMRPYFVFFTLMGFLHGVRILHLFYTAMKPAAPKQYRKPQTKKTVKKSSSQIQDEFYSVEGIIINRTYSNMRFAARSLLPSLMENELSEVFSLSFYGTREKPNQNREKEDALVAKMMGSMGTDGVTEVDESELFLPGRPDWNNIFMKALSRAHTTNPCGESVGVFFCGSPAIAKALNVAAARATSQHQYAVKKLDGKRCSCKVIVHSENF